MFMGWFSTAGSETRVELTITRQYCENQKKKKKKTIQSQEITWKLIWLHIAHCTWIKLMFVTELRVIIKYPS